MMPVARDDDVAAGKLKKGSLKRQREKRCTVVKKKKKKKAVVVLLSAKKRIRRGCYYLRTHACPRARGCCSIAARRWQPRQFCSRGLSQQRWRRMLLSTTLVVVVVLVETLTEASVRTSAHTSAQGARSRLRLEVPNKSSNILNTFGLSNSLLL